MADHEAKPVVLITGAAGSIGQALAAELNDDYRVVGFDMAGKTAPFPLFEVDLSQEHSARSAMDRVAEQFGWNLAAVVHLAAYFDFTGEENPLYEKVNVEGTRHLLKALWEFDVERFIYSSTMLVHQPAEPGGVVSEESAISPRWAYPQSKVRAEEVICSESRDMPYLILRLAGLYDEDTAVPTLAHQITRIYEREAKSHLYSGDGRAGQSFIHRLDLMRLFRLSIDRRQELPKECVLLAGEPDAVPYEELQDGIGRLVHGARSWTTLQVPKQIAKVGAWLEQKLEPIIPDSIDGGREPFIRPFMVDMADDHYALDISRAEQLLGWRPRHSIRDTLPSIIASLKDDPAGWYERNGVELPPDLPRTGSDG